MNVRGVENNTEWFVGKIVTTGDRSSPGSKYIHQEAVAQLPGLVQPCFAAFQKAITGEARLQDFWGQKDALGDQVKGKRQVKKLNKEIQSLGSGKLLAFRNTTIYLNLLNLHGLAIDKAGNRAVNTWLPMIQSILFPDAQGSSTWTFVSAVAFTSGSPELANLGLLKQEYTWHALSRGFTLVPGLIEGRHSVLA